MLHVNVDVEQIAESTQWIFRLVPAADGQRKCEALEDHRIVHMGWPLPLQPHGHAVCFQGAFSRRCGAALQGLPVRCDAERAL